jgi:hypothetical protein
MIPLCWVNLPYGRNHPAYVKFVVSMSFAITSSFSITSRILNFSRVKSKPLCRKLGKPSVSGFRGPLRACCVREAVGRVYTQGGPVGIAGTGLFGIARQVLDIFLF